MPNLIDTSSPKKSLTRTSTEHLSTTYFKVENFGFLVLTSNDKFSDTWYPTPDVIVPAGWFSVDIHNSNFGDFNNDGLPDLIIQTMLHPHVVNHTTDIKPIFLIQNASGGFNDPLDIISASTFPDKHFLYRIGIGDFNGDGVDDAVLSAMLSVNRNEGTASSTYSSPVTIYGSNSDSKKLSWIDNYDNFSLRKDAPDWVWGYGAGHNIAVGDFNGDGFDDWFSDYHILYSKLNESFRSEIIQPNTELAPLDNKWYWPSINATAAADFNEDGFDDLIYSTMPQQDSGKFNGGDLWLAYGGRDGLKTGLDFHQISRTNIKNGNIGTNFIVAADFDGDGHKDILFMEHLWTTDSGDSTYYYSKGTFRLFLGNGSGDFTEHADLIEDKYAGTRNGEGNIHVVDVNGDGWLDIVADGYQGGKETWTSNALEPETSILLNQSGKLTLVSESALAYVAKYQFAGEEKNKANQLGMGKLLPVDLGNDGMIDFVGFVETPIHRWPQVEQTYTYAYISKSIKPLGRTVTNESMLGTKNPDHIWGYDGNDTIQAGNGNDTINGGVGTDTCIYSGASSNYTITKTSSGYNIQDNVGSDAIDTLINIEKLQFTDQTIVIDVAPPIEGGGAKDKLTGTTDNDEIYGYAGNDTLTGLAGNDTLDGGTGDDSMTGGAGNDTYIADSIKDKIIEKTNEGTDTVITTATYTLANNVENLTLSGTSAINGTGNTASNIVAGNDAANSINGGLGSDTLTGGTGNDTFIFNTKLGATNIDTITDFTSGDKIALAGSIFSKLKGDKDLSDNFAWDSATTDKQFLIYNIATKKLYYDADGSGTKATQIEVAIIGLDSFVDNNFTISFYSN